MNDLFAIAGPRKLNLPGADITYDPTPDLGIDPSELFETLKQQLPWEQRLIRIQGREIPQPRLVSWHGDAAYTYSGLALTPHPWTPLLSALKERLEQLTQTSYNSVLANFYAHGRHSIGMHADNEPELGRRPTIASISLGAERRFTLARKDKSLKPVHLPLAHGSLLIMAGDCQQNWLHGIAKDSGEVGERINLTFRLTKG